MSNISKIHINYVMNSPYKNVQSAGGKAGESVTIAKTQNFILAKPVVEDIKNDVAENPGSNEYNTLIEWSKDENKYDSDTFLDGNEEDYENGKNSITAKREGETYDIKDITDKNGKVVSSGGFGKSNGKGLGKWAIGVMSSFIALGSSPFFEIVLGSGTLGLSIACLTASILFDNKLDARKAFANKVSEYIAEIESECAEIEDKYTTTIEDRKTRYQAAVDAMNAPQEDLGTEIENLTAEYKNAQTPEEQNSLLGKIIGAIMGSTKKQEKPEDVANEGFDDFYSILSEAEGKKYGYNLVSDFLNQGQELGNIAKENAKDLKTCIALCTSLIGLFAINFLKVPFFGWAAEKSVAIVGTALAGVATGNYTAAKILCETRKAEEYFCNERGTLLRTFANQKYNETFAKVINISDDVNTALSEIPTEPDAEIEPPDSTETNIFANAPSTDVSTTPIVTTPVSGAISA